MKGEIRTYFISSTEQTNLLFEECNNWQDKVLLRLNLPMPPYWKRNGSFILVSSTSLGFWDLILQTKLKGWSFSTAVTDTNVNWTEDRLNRMYRLTGGGCGNKVGAWSAKKEKKKRNTGGLLLASLNRVQALPLIRQTEHAARVLCLILSWTLLTSYFPKLI
jgi:hypothetical protein